MDQISLLEKHRKQDGGLVFGVCFLFLISSMSISLLFEFYGVLGFHLVVVVPIYLFCSLFVQVMQWNDSGYLRFCHGCYFVKDLGVFFLVLVVRITYGRYGFVYEVIKYGQHCLDGSRWDQWILGSEWYCGERWMRLMRHRQITWKYGSG